MRLARESLSRILGFLAVGTAMMAIAGLAGQAVYAQCTGMNNACSFEGISVPCSNTTFCYTTIINPPVCSTGAPIVAYKNNNPPNTWTNCFPRGDSYPFNCENEPSPCGTTTWYTEPMCGSGFSCTTSPVVNIHHCKSGDGPPC